jgi:hypothetical protein
VKSRAHIQSLSLPLCWPAQQDSNWDQMYARRWACVPTNFTYGHWVLYFHAPQSILQCFQWLRNVKPSLISLNMWRYLFQELWFTRERPDKIRYGLRGAGLVSWVQDRSNAVVPHQPMLDWKEESSWQAHSAWSRCWQLSGELVAYVPMQQWPLLMDVWVFIPLQGTLARRSVSS